MARFLNDRIIAELEQRFRDVDSGVFVNYQTFDAVKNAQFRTALNQAGISMTVVKNRLFSVAMERLGRPAVKQALNGPTAVLYAEGEAAGFRVAKTLKTLRRKFPKLSISGGYSESDVASDAEVVKIWPGMPTREEMIAQIAGSIVNMGGSVLAQVLGPARAVASQIEKIAERESA